MSITPAFHLPLCAGLVNVLPDLTDFLVTLAPQVLTLFAFPFGLLVSVLEGHGQVFIPNLGVLPACHGWSCKTQRRKHRGGSKNKSNSGSDSNSDNQND